jgi:hypothetical protein
LSSLGMMRMRMPAANETMGWRCAKEIYMNGSRSWMVVATSASPIRDLLRRVCLIE